MSAESYFLRIPGVVGVSEKADAIYVYVESSEVAKKLPPAFLGKRVVVVVVGRIGTL